MRAGNAQPSGKARADLLKGLRVQISGAVPEEEHWTRPTLCDNILAFVRRLSELVMVSGGHVVHGNHPAFTPAIVGRAQAVAEGRVGEAASRPPGRSLVSLYASELWPLSWEFPLRPDVVAVVRTPKVGDGDVKDPTTRNLSLTALRLAMAQDVDVVVTVGGKLHRDAGYNPGVLEELTVARWRKRPCFIVACCSGFAAGLDAEIIRTFSAGNTLDEAPTAAGRAGEELRRLASWDQDLPSAAGDLVDRFVKHLDEFKGRGRGEIAWPGIAIRPDAARIGEATVGVADVPRPLIDRAAGRFKEVYRVVKAPIPDLRRLAELLERPPLP